MMFTQKTRKALKEIRQVQKALQKERENPLFCERCNCLCGCHPCEHTKNI